MKTPLFASLALATLASCQSPAVGRYSLHPIGPQTELPKTPVTQESPPENSEKKSKLYTLDLSDYYIRYMREFGPEECLFLTQVRILDPQQQADGVLGKVLYNDTRILAGHEQSWKDALSGTGTLLGAQLGQRGGGNLRLPLCPPCELEGKLIEVNLRLIELDKEDNEQLKGLVDAAAKAAAAGGPEAALAAPIVAGLLKVAIAANGDDSEFTQNVSFRVIGGKLVPLGGSGGGAERYALVKTESTTRIDMPYLYELDKYAWGIVYHALPTGWIKGGYCDGFQSPFLADVSATTEVSGSFSIDAKNQLLHEEADAEGNPYQDKSYMLLSLTPQGEGEFNWTKVTQSAAERERLANAVAAMLYTPEKSKEEQAAARSELAAALDKNLPLFLRFKDANEKLDAAHKALRDKPTDAEAQQKLAAAEKELESLRQSILGLAGPALPSPAELELSIGDLKKKASEAISVYGQENDGKAEKAYATALAQSEGLLAILTKLQPSLSDAKLSALVEACRKWDMARKSGVQKEVDAAKSGLETLVK